MRISILPAGAVPLLLLLLPLAADTPPEEVPVAGRKDRIHGTIEAGAALAVRLFLPAETALRVKLRPEHGADPAATAAVFGPGGASLPLEKGRAVIPATGEVRIRVTAGAAGRYRLDVTAKPPRRLRRTGDLTEGEIREIPFGALGGTVLSVKLKGVEAVDLTGPEGEPVDLAKKTSLPADGTYRLRVRGAGGPFKVTLKLRAPKPEKRERYHSALGFGPAPEVLSLDPSEALDSGPVSGIDVAGRNFERGARVFLEKGKVELEGEVTWVSDRELSAGFDLTGARSGKWTLLVRNPSGGEAGRPFRVLDAAGVALPDGVRKDTEVWFLDFTDEFRADLADFGLRGDSEEVNQAAEEVVEAYVVHLLRVHFGRDGVKGRAEAPDAVPVSFVVEKVRDSVATPGVEYDRLRIGGAATGGPPVSDNPNLPWGYVGVDPDNTSREDIGASTEGTRALPTAELADFDHATSEFRAAFAPLLARPLTGADASYFLSGFLPTSAEDVARVTDIITAVETLSREIAGVAAHHIARAMGVANSEEGIMGTPTRFGVFGADRGLSFSPAERDLLRRNARPSDLPGRSNPLLVHTFPLLPGQPQVLPEAKVSLLYSADLSPVGGDPLRTAKTTRVTVIDVVNEIGLPLEGFAFDPDRFLLRGTPPATSVGTFWLKIGLEQQVGGEWSGYAVWHRLDVVR